MRGKDNAHNKQPTSDMEREREREGGIAVLCHLQEAVFLVPRQTKVRDLDEAVGVDEKVGRLQIAVEDVSRVDVLEPAQDLVREALDVVVG